MTRIDIVRTIPHPIDHVWDRLVDWESHSRWIPNTDVTVTTKTSGVGTEFVGVTRFGPLRLDDPMVVDEFTQPAAGRASCVVVKNGAILGGTAGFTLTSIDLNTTRLDWFEDVHLKPESVFWWTTPFVFALGRVAFGSALTRFERTLQEEQCGM